MSSFSDLVNFFSAHTNYPIKIDDIKAWLIEHGYQDSIEIFEVDIDIGITKGQFMQFTTRPRPYGDPDRTTYITVGADQSLCWKRLVIAKEMTHVIDSEMTHTRTIKDIQALTEELSSQMPDKLGSEANHVERIAVYRALSLLAPKDAIDKIKPRYVRGEVTPLEVATFFRIPEFYIPKLMSERYAQLYDKLLGE